MAHLIDKDALVAEINRKRNDYINSLMTEQVHVLNDVLDFLDTFEVKEVDLEKSLKGFMGRYAYENGDEYPSAIDIAKHYFELGLKAKKGE